MFNSSNRPMTDHGLGRIEARQDVIPVDDDAPLAMQKLCGNTEAAPLGIPLHAGARGYFKERGYF